MSRGLLREYMNMKEDLNKFWVPSDVGRSTLKFQFCSDTNRRHNMTIFRATVYVRPHTTTNGDKKWFLIYKRPKGYYIGGIFSTEELAGKIKSERKSDGSLKYLKDYETKYIQSMYELFIGDPTTYVVLKSDESVVKKLKDLI